MNGWTRIVFYDQRADAKKRNEQIVQHSNGLKGVTGRPIRRIKRIWQSSKGHKGDEEFEDNMLELEADPETMPRVLRYLQEWISRGLERSVTLSLPAGGEVELAPEPALSEQELETLARQLTGQ
jgi:hypothetical protein